MTPDPDHKTAAPGRLVLIVGPSGVGKDSLIDGARIALAQDPAFAFAVRDISRPAQAGGEAHRPVTEAEFDAVAQAGGYMLSWRAHGLCYGIPAAYEVARQRGVNVVANVSRTVIGPARDQFPPLVVVAVSAPADLLRQRLAARGRESPLEIEARIARAGDFDVIGLDVIRLINDGPLDHGIKALVAIIRGEIRP